MECLIEEKHSFECFKLIQKFVESPAPIGQLTCLRLNVDRLKCITFRPDEDQVFSLEDTYRSLKNLSRDRRLREGLKVYMNAVQLNFELNFSEYGFDKSLIEVHHRFLSQPNADPGTLCCKQVQILDAAAVLSTFWPSLHRSRFFQFYPSIQAVYLHNRGEHATLDTCQRADLLALLAKCRSLTTLKIGYYQLPPSFYTDLSTCSDLQKNLVYFVLKEHKKFVPEQPFNFVFLSRFKKLAYLCTNMATRSEMLRLVAMMSYEARAKFKFRFSLDPQFDLVQHGYYQCCFQAEEEGVSLLIENRQPAHHSDASESDRVGEAYSGAHTMQSLAKFFSQNPRYAQHWLDNASGQQPPARPFYAEPVDSEDDDQSTDLESDEQFSFSEDDD